MYLRPSNYPSCSHVHDFFGSKFGPHYIHDFRKLHDSLWTGNAVPACPTSIQRCDIWTSYSTVVHFALNGSWHLSSKHTLIQVLKWHGSMHGSIVYVRHKHTRWCTPIPYMIHELYSCFNFLPSMPSHNPITTITCKTRRIAADVGVDGNTFHNTSMFKIRNNLCHKW